MTFKPGDLVSVSDRDEVGTVVLRDQAVFEDTGYDVVWVQFASRNQPLWYHIWEVQHV